MYVNPFWSFDVERFSGISTLEFAGDDLDEGADRWGGYAGVGPAEGSAAAEGLGGYFSSCRDSRADGGDMRRRVNTIDATFDATSWCENDRFCSRYRQWSGTKVEDGDNIPLDSRGRRPVRESRGGQ